MLANDIVLDLVQGLRKIFDSTIEQIILYGSIARNEATAESDIDIALVLTNEMDDKTKNQFLIWSSDLDLRYNKIFSFVDINKQKMNQWGQVHPFYRNIQKKGIVLWQAA